MNVNTFLEIATVYDKDDNGMNFYTYTQVSRKHIVDLAKELIETHGVKAVRIEEIIYSQPYNPTEYRVRGYVNINKLDR